ncbi:hypothetical protein P691DRAFT_777605 [Macrolepiota fuliginosa MF-IS2]|uniref:BTB domain-containing protein n=1 Tax=Macrolepiota fuliginosa MF-IS2 TaxID=1400762 RepID=A0A9P6BZH0_9AGAR|nr:hypothetical protein P691DRAFT_777605 [Macrolepiota fuliginosa MF-IS2]
MSLREERPEYTRDSDYYFDDGNCRIRVNNYLFNLHRTILCRSSVVFRNMFLLPQSGEGNPSVDGDRDDHPIVCHDSLEAFRAWCWALYAGIEELGGSNSANARLGEKECAHIGLLAHKYECLAIEKWAQGALIQRLSVDDHSGRPSRSISPLRLGYILEVSTNCNWTSAVGDLVEKHLIHTIASSTTPSPVCLRNLRIVLEIAEGLGNGQLAARAYYHHLRSQKWCLALREREDRIAEKASRFSLRDDARRSDRWVNHWGDESLMMELTEAQEVRLYRGFISLSALRGRLRNMPEVSRQSWVALDCTCLASHEKKWREHAQKIWVDDSFNDITDFLVEMKRRLSIDSWTGKAHSGPGSCALVELKDEINNFLGGFEASLTEFFPTRSLPWFAGVFARY